MEKRKLNKIPCNIKAFSSSEDSNLLKVRLKVIKTGSNYNGSKFSLESIKKAEPSLYNIPILGYLKQIDDGEYDYDGHNRIMQIVENDEGFEVVEKYLERPIGVIPESSKVEYVEEDGVTYMCCDGYIWKSYANEGLGVIMNSDTKSISMEIDVFGGQFDEEDWYYDITDFRYLGITVLGDDVNPAIEGACMEKHADFSSYKEEITKICNEIYAMEKREGGTMSNQEPMVEPQEPVVEPVEPTVEPTEPVVEPIEPATEPVGEPDEPKEPTEPVEPQGEPDEPVNEFAMFEELVGEVSSNEELFEAIKTKFSELSNIIQTHETTIANQCAEIEDNKSKLEKFEAMEKEIKDKEIAKEIEGVLNKFEISADSTSELVEKVKAYEMSIADFEKEIAYLYALEQLNNKSRFSTNNQQKEPVANVGGFEPSEDPYGGLGRLLNK